MYNLTKRGIRKDRRFNMTVVGLCGLGIAFSWLSVACAAGWWPWISQMGGVASLLAFPLSLLILLATVIDNLQNERMLQLQESAVTTQSWIHDFVLHIQTFGGKMGPVDIGQHPPRLTVVVSTLAYGILECELQHDSNSKSEVVKKGFFDFILSWIEWYDEEYKDVGGGRPQILIYIWEKGVHQQQFGAGNRTPAWKGHWSKKKQLLLNTKRMLSKLEDARKKALDVRIVAIPETSLRAVVLDTKTGWKGLIAQVSPIVTSSPTLGDVRFLSYYMDDRDSATQLQQFIDENIGGAAGDLVSDETNRALSNPSGFISEWFDLPNDWERKADYG